MENVKVKFINKRDVHTLFIWCGDGVSMLENTISIQVYVEETQAKIESDSVMIYPDDGNVIVNVRSNDVDLLKAYVAEIFPHLTFTGHPTVDDEVFDNWFVYTDKRGADIINNDPDGDTVISAPTE